MYDILAKPAAIATCGLFQHEARRAKALPAQGLHRVGRHRRLHRRRADRRAGLPVQPDEHQAQHGFRDAAKGTDVWSPYAPSNAPQAIRPRPRHPLPGIPNLPARRPGALFR